MKCEVVGWLFVDAERPQLLVRDRIKGEPQPVNLDSEAAIQTGSFRRGQPIIDPVTKKTIGFEMEPLPSPYVASL
ncbi:MAG TPA: hypothetical protein VIL28_05860 [Steroidobacteraceae bacterium]